MCLEILYVKISSQEYNISVSDLFNRVYSKKLNYFISNGGGKRHMLFVSRLRSDGCLATKVGNDQARPLVYQNFLLNDNLKRP